MPGYGSTLRMMFAATEADAPEVQELTARVWADYAELTPLTSALRETEDDVAAVLRDSGGVVVRSARLVDGGVRTGELVGAARFSEHDGGFWLRRVAVDPAVRRQGIATMLLGGAEEAARERGYDRVTVGTRTALADVAAFWRGRGFHDVRDHGFWVQLERRLPVHVDVPTATDMTDLGRRLGGLLRAADLLVLTGDLGAGKTTLTRGIGVALGVRGDVTSPTFVMARVHPSVRDGPALVHVDAYRLTSLAEVDDLDLDSSLDESVTVVEWGGGMVESLASDRLEIALLRSHDPSAADVSVPTPDGARTATIRPLGARWAGVAL